MRGPITVSEMLLAALSSNCALFRLLEVMGLTGQILKLLNDGQ